jgi:nitroreductase
MNLKKLIEERYSVRAYLPKEVEKEKLDYVLECARLAPSACNNQPWFFYIISDKTLKKQIREAYDRQWLEDAPVNIVVCKNTNEAWVRKYDGKDSGDIDASIVAEHICLAVAEQGLGTCWICNFNPEKLTEALLLPPNREAVAIFPVGYIDEENSNTPLKKRKSIDEITKWI